jgi:ABC-type transport system involved in multi-copper enzyme maturation permease subunit
VSAQAGTAAHRGVPLDSRLRATARSEWIKFRSVRSAPVVLLSTVVILPAGAAILGVTFRNGWATMAPADKASFDPVYTGFMGILLAQLFVGALGAMTVTDEYTSGLIRGTFQATPQRAQVLAIKALVFALVVWFLCTVLSFATFFLGQDLLGSAKHVGIGDPGVLPAVFGGGLYLTLVGLFAMFVGVLVRRTPTALVVLFGLLIIAPFATGLLPGALGGRVGEFLPSQAGQDVWELLHGGRYTLGAWQGLGVLVAEVAATGIAAFTLILRRDA